MIEEFVKHVLLEKSRFHKETGKKHSADLLKFIESKVSEEHPAEYAFTMITTQKIGVNPQATFDTPGGTYYYPLTTYTFEKFLNNDLPYGSNRNYIGLVKLDFSNKRQWLFLNNRNIQTKTDEDVEFVKSLVGNDIATLAQKHGQISLMKSNDSVIYGYLKYYVNTKYPMSLGNDVEGRKAQIEWTKLLKKIGVTSVYDFGTGLIFSEEPAQILISDPKNYQEVGIFNVEEIRNAYDNDSQNQEVNSGSISSQTRLKNDKLLSLSPQQQEEYLEKVFRSTKDEDFISGYFIYKKVFDKLTKRSQEIVKENIPEEIYQLLYEGRKQFRTNIDLSRNETLKTLPKDLDILGFLMLSYSKIETIGDNLNVQGSLDLYRSKIRKLPNNCKVGHDLNISQAYNITKLPRNLNVKGAIFMEYSSITEIPNDIQAGSIDLSHTNVTKIADGTTLKNLNVGRDSRLLSLPKNLTVNRLSLEGSHITSLPSGLKILNRLILPPVSEVKFVLPDDLYLPASAIISPMIYYTEYLDKKYDRKTTKT
jgi:hypothetical protein